MGTNKERIQQITRHMNHTVENADEIVFKMFEEIIGDAISDYLFDKSEQPHINTLEDWVKDWLENY